MRTIQRMGREETMKKQKTMQKSRKFIGVFIAGAMTLSIAPSVMAAEAVTTTIGDNDEFTFVFNSGYTTTDANTDKESYTLAEDGTITVSFNGDAKSWKATYVPSGEAEGGYAIVDIDTKDAIELKYFDGIEKADEIWAKDVDKEVLPAYDKVGGNICVEYPGDDGDSVAYIIPVNFGSADSAKTQDTTTQLKVPEAPVTPPAAPVAPPKAPETPATPPAATVVPETPAAPASKITGTFKSTDGLNNVIPPMPVQGQDLRYTVMPNETLYGIAYNYYGSMSKSVINKIWKANAAYFQSTKGILEAGTVLTLPAQGLTNPVTASGISNAAGTYLVKTGDNLAKIAQHFYGNAELWRNIYEANKDKVQMVGRSPMIYDSQWLIIPNVAGSAYTPAKASTQVLSYTPSTSDNLTLEPGMEG